MLYPIELRLRAGGVGKPRTGIECKRFFTRLRVYLLSCPSPKEDQLTFATERIAWSFSLLFVFTGQRMPKSSKTLAVTGASFVDEG